MATTQNGIYYPADGTKSADILADMKEMAESVDEVVQEEKENQETIEQKIQELQTEQTAQNKKIEELDDNQIHITTEKANNINIKDASGQNAKIKLFGISKQETSTQGNNYFDINRANFQKGSIGEDGVTINSSSDNYYTENYIELDKAKYFLYEVESNDYNRAFIYDNNKNFVRSVNTRGTSKQTPLEIDLADNEKYIRFHYYTAETTNRKIMLSKDSVKDYEEFVPNMPSPEYISEIQNTTGDVEITDFNKNFFDENDTNNFKYGVGDDFTTKNDDGTFKTIANFSLGRNKGTKIVGLKANTDYIVSLDIKNITSTATSKAAEVEIIENAEKISIVMQKDFKNLGINTLEFNSGSYQDLSLHISGYTYSEVSKSVSVTFADVLIAEKSNDNSYVEHEQQVTTFPLQEGQKMYEGSYTADDGIHHKRKQFNLSSLTNVSDWTNKGLNENGTYTYFTRATNLMDYKKYVDLKGFCSHFEFFGTTVGTAAMQKKGVGCAFYCTDYDDKLFYINTTIATTEQLVAWLSAQETAETPVMLEYETEEETIEAYTEEQQTAHNQLQNAKTYKTVTNVFTENAEVEMEYVAHTKTYIDNEINSVKEQLNTINELLSTTTTSAMLLDNMQTDLESEVL